MSEKKTFTIATPEELEAQASKPDGNASPLLEPRPLADGDRNGDAAGDSEDGVKGAPEGGPGPGPYGGPFVPPERPILMGNPKGSRYTGWDDQNHMAGYVRSKAKSGRWIVLALLALSITAGTLIYLLIRHKL